MRIMLLVNEFPPEKIAGTAMATRSLAGYLAARGHRVLVAVTTACPESKRHLIDKGDYDLVWMQPRPVRGTGMLWRIWQAWRIARRFRPQLVQGQAVSCGLIAGALGRLLGIPSICYAQGYDVYEATPWQRRTEIRWGCGWPDVCLAVTRQLVKEIGSSASVRGVQLMPHAFEVPGQQLSRAEAREMLGIDVRARVVFCVGRLEAFKGHDVLLAAWSGVVEQRPGANLYIAGNGSRREMLQEQAVAAGIAHSVHLLGHLSADEVHQWMAASDLFVLPSRSEPFGIVLLEAMSHGLPVVASRVGGIPEVVPASGDVRLVPAEDHVALEQAMLDATQGAFHPSDSNRQHAMQFAWGLQVERFEHIYEQLLSGQRS